jgi:hypothetical protein
MSNNSIADFIVKGASLLNNLQTSAGGVPGIDVHVPPLQHAVSEAQEITSRLDTQRGVKQADSQRRRSVIKQGQVLISRIQSALKSHFGPQSERLVEFGIQPIRPRSRAKAKEPKPAPQAPTPALQATTETQSQ